MPGKKETVGERGTFGNNHFLRAMGQESPGKVRLVGGERDSTFSPRVGSTCSSGEVGESGTRDPPIMPLSWTSSLGPGEAVSSIRRLRGGPRGAAGAGTAFWELLHAAQTSQPWLGGLDVSTSGERRVWWGSLAGVVCLLLLAPRSAHGAAVTRSLWTASARSTCWLGPLSRGC